MKPTELRIRNLVYIIRRGWKVHLPIEIPMQILQVGLFNSEVLKADINPGTVKEFIKVPNCDLSPISLTEQWLKDFGFEKRDDQLCLYFCNYTESILWFNQNSGQLRLVESNGKYLTHDNLKYLHQLQNLYFALTDKELTKN